MIVHAIVMLSLSLSLAIYRTIMIVGSNRFYSCGWPHEVWYVNSSIDCRESSEHMGTKVFVAPLHGAYGLNPIQVDVERVPVFGSVKARFLQLVISVGTGVFRARKG